MPQGDYIDGEAPREKVKRQRFLPLVCQNSAHRHAALR